MDAEAKEKLASVTSEHVYSVGAALPKDSSGLADVDFQASKMSFDESVESHALLTGRQTLQTTLTLATPLALTHETQAQRLEQDGLRRERGEPRQSVGHALPPTPH